MTAEWWEVYSQQVQSSGAADLTERLPRNVQEVLESLNLNALTYIFSKKCNILLCSSRSGEARRCFNIICIFFERI